MMIIAGIVALLCFTYTAEGAVSSDCLDCIWQVESRKASHLGCSMDVTSTACGPYQIHHNYYKDCTKNKHASVTEWQACTQEADCSRACVQNYLNHYGGKKCPNDCEGYARMHNGGPRGCRNSNTDVYWKKIRNSGCSSHS